MSLVGQVDWYFQVTVCARPTCGMATVPTVAAPAASAPVFRNLRRVTAPVLLAHRFLLLETLPRRLEFQASYCCAGWYTTACPGKKMGQLAHEAGQRGLERQCPRPLAYEGRRCRASRHSATSRHFFGCRPALPAGNDCAAPRKTSSAQPGAGRHARGCLASWQ